MVSASSEQLTPLRAHAVETAERAVVPYSKRRDGVALLLSDGAWIPGVRVESATFSLTIPSLQNAVTTAAALDRTDVVAAACSRPFRREELLYLRECALIDPLHATSPDVLAAQSGSLPEISHPVSPFVEELPADDVAGAAPEGGDQNAGLSEDQESVRGRIRTARSIAVRAHVPESDFPVGCVIDVGASGLVPGVNVEHDDWTRILCAERNALGTCISYGLRDIHRLYVTCLNEPEGTPCGACRQLLVELAPTAVLWMDRGSHPPSASDPQTLLPGSFRSEHLSKNT